MGNKGRPRENCRETGRDSQVVKMMNMFLKKSEQGLGLLSKKVKSLSLVLLFATPWTVARQAPLSMGFSRQEYWHGLPFPSPGDLPNPGIKPGSPALQADASPSEPPGKVFQDRPKKEDKRTGKPMEVKYLFRECSSEAVRLGLEPTSG